MSEFYTRENSNVSKLWFVVVLAVAMMVVVVWKTQATIADIEGRVTETEALTKEILNH